MKKLLFPLLFLAAYYLDSVFFSHVSLFGAKPDMLMAALVCMAILLGGMQAGMLGAFLGLLMDILLNPILGISSIGYIVAAAISGLFYQKFYADNVIVPAVTAVVAGFVKDLLFAAVVALSGARMGFGLVLLQYILPSAAMTGAAAMGIYLICKPLLLRQVSRTLSHR